MSNDGGELGDRMKSERLNALAGQIEYLKSLEAGYAGPGSIKINIQDIDVVNTIARNLILSGHFSKWEKSGKYRIFIGPHPESGGVVLGIERFLGDDIDQEAIIRFTFMHGGFMYIRANGIENFMANIDKNDIYATQMISNIVDHVLDKD